MGVIGIGKIDRWAKFMEDFLPLSLRGPFPFQKWEGFQIIWKLMTFKWAKPGLFLFIFVLFA